jgi:hypothetical protein
MKLDPGMHIGMHLVCFSKTGCDSFSLEKIDDRLLAIFLMDHIEVDPLGIVINGRELPITPLIVKHVLGLPNGTKALPVVSASDKAIHQQEHREECEQKGMKKLVSERHKKNSKIKRFQDLKPNEVPRYCPLPFFFCLALIQHLYLRR